MHGPVLKTKSIPAASALTVADLSAAKRPTLQSRSRFQIQIRPLLECPSS